MLLKLSVDRIEQGIAVCYSDDDEKYELSVSGLSEGDIIAAEFDKSGKLISYTVLTDETQQKKSELAMRTKNLFNRNKG